MNMCRIVTSLILLFISTAITFSQILNARGLKVVEKIEVEQYQYQIGAVIGETDKINTINSTTIILKYDVSNHLTGLYYRCQMKNHRTNTIYDLHEKRFTLSNGKLTRKDYENGNVKKDFTFNYVLDGNIITKREVFNHAIDGSNECLRFDNEYTYTSDTDGTPILSRDTSKWYVRMRGTNFFQKGDGDDGAMIGRYYKENGNFYKAISVVHNNGSHSDDPIRYQDYEYSDLANDTNVNWNAIPTDSAEPTNLEFLTEWVNVRSDHLLNKYCGYEYKYSYDNGNISTIEVYKSGKLRAKFTITYKMD